MDFDETRLYYSHQQLQTTAIDEQQDENVQQANAVSQEQEEEDINLDACRRHFREFLRNYRLGAHRYIYRDRLLRLHRRRELVPALAVDLAHLGEYDSAILGYLLAQPATLLPTLEQAASDALTSLLHNPSANNNNINPTMGGETNSNNGNENTMEDDNLMSNENTPDAVNGGEPVVAIQILLTGQLQSTPLRQIHAKHMNRLLQCPGIVVSTSPVKSRATQLCICCHRCLDEQVIINSGGPWQSIPLPTHCQGPNSEECGRNPYTSDPDKSKFVDQQTIKLQEAPERVPTGEMPRSVVTVVDRALVDRAPPGTRVSMLCIPTLMPSKDQGTKSVYLRVVGMIKDDDAHGPAVRFAPAEEEAFTRLAARPDVYQILQRSFAPNLQGSYTVDIKKAILCQMMGGSKKKTPDGLRLRPDINLLLLGDPSMAKSQFLKFASKVAPVGIYTSGKGSSAAGLTASVVRDAKGEFYLEGGAMVLADGGLVCIDEFDKMRPTDRVAIHEAMEQQTISVAKAGITTVLNARAAVLAAANPVYGRYDDMKSASENIDLMTTILSRFDLIFLVRDIREEERDRMICQHVMGVHMGASGRDNANTMSSLMQQQNELSTAEASAEAIAANVSKVAMTGQGELDVASLRKFIQFCRARCSPRLTEEAGSVLTSTYVKIRDDVRQKFDGSSSGSAQAIPITVRQLEALVRVSESLAKMRLDDQVRSEDVTEAMRLFKVSTMAANAADQHMNSSIMAGAQTNNNRDEMERVESFLKSRLMVGGSLVNKLKLIEEAAGQGFHAVSVARVLSVMAGRGELMERNSGRLIKRIK